MQGQPPNTTQGSLLSSLNANASSSTSATMHRPCSALLYVHLARLGLCYPLKSGLNHGKQKRRKGLASRRFTMRPDSVPRPEKTENILSKNVKSNCIVLLLYSTPRHCQIIILVYRFQTAKPSKPAKITINLAL